MIPFLGVTPATFTGGARLFANIGAYNQTIDLFPTRTSWHIENNSTGTITFETPAEKVQFFAAALLPEDGEISVFDSNDNLLTTLLDVPQNMSYAFSDPPQFFDFQATELGSQSGIGKITYANGSQTSTGTNYQSIALDDFGFTPIGDIELPQIVSSGIEAFYLGNVILLEPVATGLALTVAITHAGDGSNRLFVTLQEGQIVIFDGNNILPVPFLDIEQRVSSLQPEQGLLSVAFHPDYTNNGFFYVNYTDSAGNTVIARYSVSSDPNIADPNSADILLNISQPFGNHNGGQLKFGPDGYLYIGMGDGGSAGDPFNNSQSLNTLLGKMLRIDVDNGSSLCYSSR